MAKWLDTDGLSYLWTKIKNYVDSKTSSGSSTVFEYKKEIISTADQTIFTMSVDESQLENCYVDVYINGLYCHEGIDYSRTGETIILAKGLDAGQSLVYIVRSYAAGTVTVNSALDIVYPLGAVYSSANGQNPSLIFGGTWSLIGSKVIDTRWQDFSWTNADYIGTSQSGYSNNKWRVRDNVLYIDIGVGSTSTIDSGSDVEVARIPITGAGEFISPLKYFVGAVGANGATVGFYAMQATGYLSIYLKPHTSADAFTGKWFAGSFAIPMNSNFTITSGSYDKYHQWKRTA